MNVLKSAKTFLLKNNEWFKHGYLTSVLVSVNDPLT